MSGHENSSVANLKISVKMTGPKNDSNTMPTFTLKVGLALPPGCHCHCCRFFKLELNSWVPPPAFGEKNHPLSSASALTVVSHYIRNINFPVP